MSNVVLPALVGGGLRLLAHAYTDPAVLPFPRPLLRVLVEFFLSRSDLSGTPVCVRTYASVVLSTPCFPSLRV